MRSFLIIFLGLFMSVVRSEAQCYDLEKVIPCGNERFPRQAGDYATEEKRTRFIMSHDYVVIDHQSDLYWAQCTLSLHKAYCESPIAMTWKQAKGKCNEMVLHQRQWRLPTVMELNSLLKLEALDVKIDTHFFSDTQKAAYWTGIKSLTYQTQGNRAWFVDFMHGAILDAAIGSQQFVRCVSSEAHAP